MTEYLKFVEQLRAHQRAHNKLPEKQWRKKTESFLNGFAGEELRRLVDKQTRRQYGAFFTCTEVAYQLILDSKISFNDGSKIYDPAVGAGNLLIAAYKTICKKGKEVTLLGTDLHKEFVNAAELRLDILQQLNRGQKRICSPTVKLAVADGLFENSYYEQATHILTNPPFNLVKSDKTVTWAHGKISAAAMFIDRIIRYTKPGTIVVAILPEVLRSGSRYEKWRRMVEQHCAIAAITLLGQFDKHTDIDVFSVVLTKRDKQLESVDNLVWKEHSTAWRTIKDLFDVSVGNVVDNRDPEEGTLRPFIVSRGLTGWQTIAAITRSRRFAGKPISSPFVVIKRTSRMGDPRRAVATIVNSEAPVYVDNHLIVVQPKSGSLRDCQFLLQKLNSVETDNWIDQQIRCRHLTVKVVKEIPV